VKESPKKKERAWKTFSTFLIFLEIGMLLIGWGVTDSWNSVIIVFRSICSEASILETAELRLYLKLMTSQIVFDDTLYETFLRISFRGESLLSEGIIF